MISEQEIIDIYDRYSHDIYLFIYSFVHSRENAEDIMQDVFEKFIAYAGQNKTYNTNIRGFLFTIAKNKCIDYARSRNRYVVTSLEGEVAVSDPTEERVEFNELQQKIDELLEECDAVSKSVFILKKECQMTYAEIAISLQISERTAKRHMKKVLAFLARKLKKYDYGL